jgi:hypothetical protein
MPLKKADGQSQEQMHERMTYMKLPHSAYIYGYLGGSDRFRGSERRRIHNLDRSSCQGGRGNLRQCEGEWLRYSPLRVWDFVAGDGRRRCRREDVKLLGGNMIKRRDIGFEVLREHFFGNMYQPIGKQKRVVLVEVAAVEYLGMSTLNRSHTSYITYGLTSRNSEPSALIIACQRRYKQDESKCAYDVSFVVSSVHIYGCNTSRAL